METELNIEIRQIDPKTISVRKGWNCRDFSDPENKAHVQALAASIRAVGIKEPLTVILEEKGPVLINGESRLRAIRLLEKEGHVVPLVPVIIDKPGLSEGDKLAEQIIRNSGKAYTVLEQAAVFERLNALGWDDKQIAEGAGLTLERVRQIKSLTAAPEPVKEQVRAGTVSATLVQRVISQSESPEEVEEKVMTALERAKAEGKETAGPRHLAPRARQPAEPPAPAPAPAAPEQLPETHMIRVSAKSLMAELMGYAETERKKGGVVSVTFQVPAERWARIKAAVH